MYRLYNYSLSDRLISLLAILFIYFGIIYIIDSIKYGLSPTNPYAKIGFFCAFPTVIFCSYIFIKDFFISPYYERPIILEEDSIINLTITGKKWKEICYKDIVLIKKPKEICRKYHGREKEQKFTLVDKNNIKIYFFNDVLYHNWKEREREYKPKNENSSFRDLEFLKCRFAIDEVLEFILSRIDKEKCKIIEY